MTIDVKCPHCKKETDYNLNYDEDFCKNCGKEITYGDMYKGYSGIIHLIKVKGYDLYFGGFHIYGAYVTHYDNFKKYANLEEAEKDLIRLSNESDSNWVLAKIEDNLIVELG